jgi:DNA repair exonuclease SbcCD nuclease subunit
MKFAIIGDTHFGVARSNEQFHQYFKLFFAEFFEYTKKNRIKRVVQTGDLFDYRKEVHFNTLYNVKQYFYSEIEKQGIKLYVVCGNHDSLYTNTNRINSVRLLLEDKPWATIVDMVPTTVDIGGFSVDLYPWVNKENLQLVTDFAAECNSDIAIGHFEFSQFQLSPGISIEHGMDHRIFKDYHTVFSGHFHTHSQRDNIIYTGTPYELTWIDSADPKGFWVFDSETMEAERVINKNQLFVKIG